MMSGVQIICSKPFQIKLSPSFEFGSATLARPQMNEKGLKIRFGREHLASNRYRLIELPDDHCVNAIKSGDYE